MIKNELKLAIVQIGSADISREIEFAEKEGIKTRVYNLPADITTIQLRKKMAEISHIKENNGVILQFPLPEHINVQYVLNGIVPKKDVNVVSSRAFGDFATGRSMVLPPAVGAIKEILEKNNIEIKNKNVAIINLDILLSKPLAIWLMNQGANIFCSPKDADIIIGVDNSNILIEAENKKFIVDSGLITEMIFKNLMKLSKDE